LRLYGQGYGKEIHGGNGGIGRVGACYGHKDNRYIQVHIIMTVQDLGNVTLFCCCVWPMGICFYVVLVVNANTKKDYPK
jgi:hypothetical protein